MISISTKNNKYAFTLAEVLITLVIVGVIAAMTVPSLIQTTERNEYVAALKKAQSVLAQTLYRITLDNGYPIGDYEFFLDTNFIEDFASYTNVVKICNNQQECFGSSLYRNGEYKLLNNTKATGWLDGKSVITTDGIMYTFIAARSIHNIYGISPEDQARAIGRVIVDVNGQRKPNKFGLDTFIFYLINGKGFVPAGAYTSTNCRRGKNGADCAGRVLRENTIKY